MIFFNQSPIQRFTCKLNLNCWADLIIRTSWGTCQDSNDSSARFRWNDV